jgi:hypothetical protein
MKKISQFMALLAFVLSFSGVIYAADESKTKEETVTMKPMGGGMEGDMNSEHLHKMQAHILAMHELSAKILAEKDPKKQEELKNQQLELMKSHMAEKMAHHHGMMKHSDNQGKK